MWQRFSQAARKVVFYAQEEAQQFGEGYVSTEHLLLGLVRETDCCGCKILTQVGVSPERVRTEVVKQLPRGDARPSQDMTLTPRAKRVIDLACSEAQGLGHNYIGTEHLLLGLIREGDGLGGRVLAKLGVELEAAREARLLVGEEESEGGSAIPSVTAAAASLASPANVASTVLAMRKLRLGADLVCLIFLFERGGAARRLIERAGGNTLLLAELIEEEVLAMKTPSEIQQGFVSCSELLTLASDESKNLGQQLNGAHFILAAMAHGGTATARSLQHLGIDDEKLKAVLAETTEG